MLDFHPCNAASSVSIYKFHFFEAPGSSKVKFLNLMEWPSSIMQPRPLE